MLISREETMENNECFIEIDGLSFSYFDDGLAENGQAQNDDGEIHNTHEAIEKSQRLTLDDLSISVEKGQFVAVIGRNGSGKSTLAKMLNALMLPTKGKVIIAGMDTTNENKLWDIRQRVGMVFQNPDNQLVSAVVEDDVAFGPENMGMPPEAIRSRVDEALESVGMTEHADRSPHLLSGGQKQRIAIAGVLAMKPECIVFDEPTAMLDPMGRDEILKTIKILNKEGITTLLITHFMEEAVLADRIIILNDGKIEMDGSPAEIFRRHDQLKRLSLESPFAVELAEKLRMNGVKIPEDILDMEELAKYLCQLK